MVHTNNFLSEQEGKNPWQIIRYKASCEFSGAPSTSSGHSVSSEDVTL